MDSAASRAMMHAQQVRTAQSSMAINVNVNVEWWDSDKLHSHYMDVDRGHFAVGEHPSVEVAKKNGTSLPAPLPPAFVPTLRSVPQGTVMQRDQNAIRSVQTYQSELEKGVKQTLSAVGEGDTLDYGLAAGTTGVGNGGVSLANIASGDPSAVVAKRELAMRRLSSGKGEYEGAYIRPDPRGVDADAHGEKIYDQRALAPDDVRAGGYLAGASALTDNRVWDAGSL